MKKVPSRIRPLLFAALVSLLPCALSADFYTVERPSVIGTGALLVDGANAVTVDKAVFNLVFGESSCDVSVEYVLHNYGGTAAFPVSIPVYYLSDGAPGKNWDAEEFSVPVVSADSIKIPCAGSTVLSQVSPGYIRDYMMISSDKPPLIGAYYYTFGVKIPPKQPSSVKVNYRVSLFHEVYMSSQYPLTDTYGYLQFLLDFRPLAGFGDGIIGELKIVADTSVFTGKSSGLVQTVFPEDALYSSWPGGFSYTVSNILIGEALPLYLAWDMSGYFNAGTIITHRLPADAVKKTVASTILNYKQDPFKEFSLTSLYDNRLDTCWSEGKKGSGVGEWIEVTIKKGYKVSAVAIATGYLKTENLYKKNSVPVKFRVDFIYPGGKVKSVTAELPKLPYNNMELYSHIRKLAELDAPERVDKIRITILDVSPGKKYDNACISELYILGEKAAGK
ncbi:MAG: hypothetical protein HPY53_16590 [Brevinematales bacterium]|nr:hypothetical protein [Brevinematales bacterium]